MTEFSIIIPTLNALKFIRPCLDSVFGQYSQDFEVIVVDNGSRDGGVDCIKQNYPQVKLIENQENLGACKGRNQGIEIAKGKWLLTLDCDVILEKDFLSKILNKTKDLSPRVGMIQPRILKTDRKTIYSLGIFLSFLKRFYDLGKGKVDNGQFNNLKYVFGACSAAALYKRRCLEEIKEGSGYFDERFFFLVEDVDLAWRAQMAGWKALFYPQAVCYHQGNSSCNSKLLRQYLCWRNRKLMLEKHREGRVKKYAVSLGYDLPRLSFLFLTNPYVRNEIKNNFSGETQQCHFQ